MLRAQRGVIGGVTSTAAVLIVIRACLELDVVTGKLALWGNTFSPLLFVFCFFFQLVIGLQPDESTLVPQRRYPTINSLQQISIASSPELYLVYC